MAHEAGLVDSAPAALDRLRATASRGEPYDIVVLDMFMPGMDGLQLARANRAITCSKAPR